MGHYLSEMDDAHPIKSIKVELADQQRRALIAEGWTSPGEVSDLRAQLAAKDAAITEWRLSYESLQAQEADIFCDQHAKLEAAEAQLAAAREALKKALLWTDEECDVGEWRDAARAQIQGER